MLASTKNRPAGTLPDQTTVGDVATVYQPIVDLAEGLTVAYEVSTAPSAGLVGGRLPGARRRPTPSVDPSQRGPTAAEAAGVGPQTALFLPAEPGRLFDDDVQAADLLRHAGAPASQVLVHQVTNRDLSDRPADTVRAVRRLRDAGFLVAVDDVGSQPDSLALLDLVRPDIVELDLGRIHHTPLRIQARTLAAVAAHAERTGAMVLATRTDSSADLERARACGAVLAQGAFFGDPVAEVDPRSVKRARHFWVRGPEQQPTFSPFELAGRVGGMRVASKHWLTSFSRHIEAQADNAMDPPVLITALQAAVRYNHPRQSNYERLAQRCPLVAVLGADLPRRTSGRVRLTPLSVDDPLRREWSVVALGAHTAVALLARDLGDDGPDVERRFSFVITYDRDVVTDAARTLLTRVHDAG